MGERTKLLAGLRREPRRVMTRKPGTYGLYPCRDQGCGDPRRQAGRLATSAGVLRVRRQRPRPKRPPRPSRAPSWTRQPPSLAHRLAEEPSHSRRGVVLLRLRAMGAPVGALFGLAARSVYSPGWIRIVGLPV